jgi:endoglucanase
MDFEISRGTNISHWLSQSQRRGQERRRAFTRDDVRRIADWGFDHLRLPVDEEQLWDESGRRESEAFDLLQAALDWCAAAGLRSIVDLHILRCHHFNQETVPALYTDDAAARHFANLWRDLSDALAGRPTDAVAYELLNEPVAPDPEDWNRVALAALAAVREREPQRTVVLGSNNFQSCDTFDRLDVPDRQTEPGDCLVLSCHFYRPMFVTHYRAPWWRGGCDYDGPVEYPGRPIPEEAFSSLAADRQEAWGGALNEHWDREAMLAAFAKPQAVRKKTGRPLYCGEFGCRLVTPEPARTRWYRDLVSVFDELQIAFANWDYRGGFGLVDADGHDTGTAALLLGAV